MCQIFAFIWKIILLSYFCRSLSTKFVFANCNGPNSSDKHELGHKNHENICSSCKKIASTCLLSSTSSSISKFPRINSSKLTSMCPPSSKYVKRKLITRVCRDHDDFVLLHQKYKQRAIIYRVSWCCFIYKMRNFLLNIWCGIPLIFLESRSVIVYLSCF